jgi:ribosomal protein S27AE
MDSLGYPVKGEVYIEKCPLCGDLMKYIDGLKPRTAIYWSSDGELRCLRVADRPKGGRFICNRCGHTELIPCPRCGRGMILLKCPPVDDYMITHWRELEERDFQCPFCPSWLQNENP